ncbi:uncharacterized protein TrAtP1_012853 [Trichoderma atroviride]|uniref:uncharacterized protein n=1 Tax=Hypocrea atroviridis TaxID=63577 RepID=UPI0033309635|nr:hypothetical protein TrAtP1_012853 [Trichoderma atroviride]
MPRHVAPKTPKPSPSRPNRCNSPLIFSQLDEADLLDDGPKRAPPPHKPKPG